MLDSKSEQGFLMVVLWGFVGWLVWFGFLFFLQWSVYFKMYQAVKKKHKFVHYVDCDVTIYQHMNFNCEDDIGEVFSES